MSFGNTATPPHPIGSPQPTKVRPATEGGAALPGLYPMNAETKARYAASKK